ncbi:hypothetical protein [Sulfitobacter aestuariivivens]
MMFYGAEFPAFLENFSPLSHLGYLPDAARLDLAIRAAYHAADAKALTAYELQALSEERLLTATFALAPATRILRSRWPLYDIWRFNFEDDTAKPRDTAQNVLVTRPAFDPVPHALPLGAATWFAALQDGIPFGEAHERTLTACDTFDLTAALALALETGALTMTTNKDHT